MGYLEFSVVKHPASEMWEAEQSLRTLMRKSWSTKPRLHPYLNDHYISSYCNTAAANESHLFYLGFSGFFKLYIKHTLSKDPLLRHDFSSTENNSQQ